MRKDGGGSRMDTVSVRKKESWKDYSDVVAGGYRLGKGTGEESLLKNTVWQGHNDNHCLEC